MAFLAVEEPPDLVEKRKKKGFDHYIYEEEVRSAQVWIVDLEDEDAEPHIQRHQRSAAPGKPETL